MTTITNNDEINSNNQAAQFLAPETSTEQFSTTLFAQPYNLDAQGFYFHSTEEFEAKSENLRDRFGCQSARNFDHVSALNFDQATETISGA